MRVILCLALAGFTVDAHRFLREIHVDKNSGLTAPKVEPGTVLSDELVQKIAEEARVRLRENGYRDPQVKPEVIPVNSEQADLHLHSQPGPRYMVHEVRLTGDPAAPASKLRHQPYSDSAIAAEMERLRSVYYARGYFDAEVERKGVEYDGTRATVTLEVKPGKHYDAARPAAEICGCILDARRQAEREGRLDFNAQLAQPGGVPQIETGEPFRVGRIEFSGNHHFSDLRVRRVLLLEEGDLFVAGRLRQSLARINQLGFFDPVGEESVQVRRREDNTADVIIALRERKKGRWSISGPVGPPSLAGPLEGIVSMRLPSSTWFVSSTWMAFNPIAKYLPFLPQKPWIPLVSLDRPLLPGQAWTTGLSVSPQFGWQGVAASYVVRHAAAEARAALGLDRVPEPELDATVEGRPGVLTCSPPQPRLWWARTAAGMALNFIQGFTR